MSINDNMKQVISNMHTHYSGLMKEGTRDFGNDFVSKSIFNAVDTNHDGSLSQQEIDTAMPNLDSYIAKSIEKDDFYANLHFGKSYSESKAKTNPNSDKTVSEQIVENNLNEAVEKILSYAKAHPEDAVIQKYAQKLNEIVSAGKLILTDIEDSGVAGRANKDADGGDTVLIDNHDSMQNLTSEYLLRTLLHELRHTVETDNINSKAEEVETERTARELADKIGGKHRWGEVSLSEFEESYRIYAEASPGTYNIPENTGIAVWYKPKDVTMKDNKLVIKSDAQPDLKGAIIEDHVQFGEQKDENGNPFPISATRVIKDKDGKIISTIDYGKYDSKKRQFDYYKVHMEQIKLKNQLNPQAMKQTMGFGLG